ncbi:hypothetical protein V9T40_007796 [Parthenolecanium corni]|uniref:Uncharacterized protein n=1 Tax=Parthenolecanium corni TaxID=536013 RepID=A0AAN9TJZ5_9HEMI
MTVVLTSKDPEPELEPRSTEPTFTASQPPPTTRILLHTRIIWDGGEEGKRLELQEGTQTSLRGHPAASKDENADTELPELYVSHPNQPTGYTHIRRTTSQPQVRS